MDNDKGEYYRIAAFDAAVHVKTYQTLHSMGVVLNSLRAPRTNVEWAQVQADAEASSERLKSKRSQYRWPWLLRTYIFAEMRHAGVNSLKLSRIGHCYMSCGARFDCAGARAILCNS